MNWLYRLVGHARVFAERLSDIQTFIILSLLYFIVIFPLSIVFRLFGKSVLRPSRSETEWHACSDESGFEKPF
jgi:uncharacterized membrane protein